MKANSRDLAYAKRLGAYRALSTSTSISSRHPCTDPRCAAMPPRHIAQTSTEAKKAYKKNGPVISERTHKQLQRGYELEQRAAREREAEKRRKLAKERREERERKETAIRQQLGVGLATQMIGYSHTQANLKKGMEAFLGVNKRKQDEERRRGEEEQRKEEELAKKLEVIAQDIEKEPFDNDDGMEDAMLGLPAVPAQDAGHWVDDELDDDTLLEVHDLVMSDPIEETIQASTTIPPQPATAPPTPHKQTPQKSQHSPHNRAAQVVPPEPLRINAVKANNEFMRVHGPINRAVESALEKLPGAIIELLSEDSPSSSSDWVPANGLLYKLCPIGLPPHRLRVKVGCVVVCLRDLNISSQLSKSQYVRILRVENERLECLTLDGQLAGTKTVITRVSFPAKYRNDAKYSFTRTQYPIRVATDYVSTDIPRDTTQSGFKLPAINRQMRPPTLVKRPTPLSSRTKPHISSNPSFKLPGLPVFKAQAANPPPRCQPIASPAFALDRWDDFLESGTQIARELSADHIPQYVTAKTVTRPASVIESVPPLSTQDLDFSLDDLDDEPQPPQTRPESQQKPEPLPQSVHKMESRTSVESVTKLPLPSVKAAVPNKTPRLPLSVPPGPLRRTANIRRIDPESENMPTLLRRPQKAPQSKLKRPMAPPAKPAPAAKKACVAPVAPAAPSLPTLATANTTTNSRRLSDFGLSTQEASSFFDDDDDFAFGSPPIAV
jgi:hypothetical protein